MSLYYIKRKSMLIAGTAIIGAVVAVLEMSRFLRIPFPLFPILKFDVVGIPMILTYFLFGLLPGVTTCFISFAIISFRNPFGGLMKCAAEIATIVGAFLILRKKGSDSYKNKLFAVVSSILLRVVVMAMANILLLPVFYPMFYTTRAAIVVLPFICIFNSIQGLISIFGGFLVHEAITQRFPPFKT